MRNVSSDIFTDEFFGSLNRTHRLLWLGLLLNLADDQGRFMDNVALIRSLLFPYDSDVTVKDVEKGLALFASKHKVLRYTAGTNGSGKQLIQITNWWKYQRSAQWAGRSQYQAPPKWNDRIRMHIADRKIDLLNWENEGGYTVASKSLRRHKVVASKSLRRQDKEEEDKDKTLFSSLKGTAQSFSEKIEKITPVIDAELSTLMKSGVPAGWIDEAIEIAFSKKKHRASYVIGILKNWKSEGRSNDKPERRNHQSANKPTPRGRQTDQSTHAARSAAAKLIIDRKRKADANV